MSFSGRHVETGSLIGSWPLIPAAVTGQPVLLPRTMQDRATILGILREPSAGYDVDGRTFNLRVDGAGSPTPVNFSNGGNPLPLSTVIAQINLACTPDTVAFNDNGFLRLRSPTVGGAGSLELITDSASSPTDVFKNLGLFAGTLAYGGDLVSAQQPDPDRQVSPPGQMTMSEGESFEARVFNRAIAQLSINNDRNEGQLSKKRLAVKANLDTLPVYAPPAAPGIQLSGGNLVYVGKTATPTVEQLRDLFVVLDEADREYTNDVYTPQVLGAAGDFSIITDGTGRQQVVALAFDSISMPAAEREWYVLSSAFTGGAAVLNGKPLKIQEVKDGAGAASYAIIENIDPATGQRVTITQSSVSFEVVSRDRLSVVVDGVYPDAAAALAGTPRLEAVKVAKRTSITPTRVEMGNRVVFVGQNFTTGPAVQVGDIVTWGSSTINSPFNNNGDYRVDKVIDKETLQVVGADWGPALLNPDSTSGTFGTVTITTDGDFVLDPFLRFSSSPSYTLPVTGSVVRLGLFHGETFRAASDANPALLGGDVRFGRTADETVAKAITQMWGPSVTSVDDVLYQDQRVNLESLNSRLNWEHYNYDDAEKAGGSATDTSSFGRHKDVRPDTINMWYWTPVSKDTPRVTLRGYGLYGHAADSDTTSDSVLQLRNSLDQLVLNVDGDGRMSNKASLSADISVWQDFAFYSNRTEPNNLGGYNITGDRIIWRGLHSWSSATANPDYTSLYGQQLLTSLDLTSTSASKFGSVIGQQIRIDTTSGNIVGAVNLKFLELTGALLNAGGEPDNQDAVETFYGIHVNYTLSPNLMIYSDHYGLKIADITRAGTAAGGSGVNYAVYTGKGEVRHGDRVRVDPWQAVADNYGLYVGAASALAVGTAYGVRVVFPTGGAGGSLYGLKLEAASVTSTTTQGISLGSITSTGVTTGYKSGVVTGDVAIQLDLGGTVSTSVTGDSIGVDIGAVQGAGNSAIGLRTNGVVIPGGLGYGIFVNTISGANQQSHGINIESVAGATQYNYGLRIGSVGGTATSNYGVSVGTVNGTADYNYGIRVVGVTGTATANQGVEIGGVSGGTTNYGIRLTGVSGAATTNHGVEVGGVTGGTTNYGIRLTGVSGAATTNHGIWVGGVSGGTSNYAIYTDVGIVRLGDQLTIYPAADKDYGIFLASMTSALGPLDGLHINGVATTAVNGEAATGIFVGNVTSATGYTSYGIRLGDMSGSAAYGLLTGSVTALVTQGVGISVGMVTSAGTYKATGIDISAPVAASGGGCVGLAVAMGTTGVSAFGVQVGTATSSTTSLYGYYVSDFACGAASGQATGVSVATMTSSGASGKAWGYYADEVTSSGSGGWAYGIELASVVQSHASGGPAFGLKIGDVSASGTAAAAIGIAVGSVTNAAQALGFHLSGGAFTSGAASLAVGMHLDGGATNSGAGGTACGLVVGSATASHATNGIALGVRIDSVYHEGTTTGYGSALWISAVSSPRLSYGVYVNESSASAASGNAYGIYVNSASATNTSANATGIWVGAVDAAATAYGIDVAAPTGTATSASLHLAMPITGTTAHGINIAAGSSASSTMYGLQIGALTSTVVVFGISVASVSGSNAYSLSTGGVTATANGATGVAVSFSGCVATGTNSTASTLSLGESYGTDYSFGILLANMSHTVAEDKAAIRTGLISGDALNNYGVHVQAITGASQSNCGFKIDAISGASNVNYGFNIDSVSGASNSNYGIYIASVTGTLSYAIYTNAGVVRLGDVLRMPVMSAPSAGQVGDMYMDTGGVLKVCTVAGTPGTWVSVGSQT